MEVFWQESVGNRCRYWCFETGMDHVADIHPQASLHLPGEELREQFAAVCEYMQRLQIVVCQHHHQCQCL